MRWSTVIIVDVLAAIGIAAVVVDASRIPAGPVETEVPQRLFSEAPLPVDEVTRIALARRDEPAVVFERRGTDWRQVEPFEHPMDPFSVRQLITQATELEVADRLDEALLEADLNPALLGFEPPVAELTYAWPGGSTTLQFGHKSPAGRAFLRVAGEPWIYVTGQSLHQRAVDMDPKEWRDRQVFMRAGAESDRIEWTSGEGGVVLVRDGRRWSMQEPVATRLDSAAASEFLQAVGRARHGGFILDEPEALGEFGLEPPAATLTVTRTDLEESDGDVRRQTVEQRLLVGARMSAGSQERYGLIEGRPVVIRLNEAVLAALFRPAGRLVDPTASGVDAADVKSVRILTDEEQLDFERDLDRWIAPDLAGRDVETPLVESLLATVTATRAPELEIKPYPYELQVAIVTLFGFDGGPLDTIRIARDPDTGQWALENGDNVLRVFPASLQPRLTSADYGLRPPAP
ncbi:MAG: DUF4340 domain-containing protein [Planctomycetota bacterium]|jgi:hypothetical protein